MTKHIGYYIKHLLLQQNSFMCKKITNLKVDEKYI